MAPTSAPGASGAVGFLDLPPEIRNTIYELALIHRSNASNRFVFMACLRPDLGKIQRGVMSANRDWYPSDDRAVVLAPGLLATCKQVHQEALPVLYGNNPFFITADTSRITYAIRDGRIQFPRTVRAMRIIEFHGVKNQAVVKSLLLVLQNMLDLDTLSIDAGLRRNFKVPHTMAKALLPLVQGINAGRRGTDRKQAMDVIKFTYLSQRSWYNQRMTSVFAQDVMDIPRESLA